MMHGLTLLSALIITVSLAQGLPGGHYVPKQGDYFEYQELVTVGNGFGNYSGYTDSTNTQGSVHVTAVASNGTESAYYQNNDSWADNQGDSNTWTESGIFTFSANTFLYVHGTDNQTGYTNPYVWFYMNNSLPRGSSFTVLNTGMTVVSTDDNYELGSTNQYYVTIFAEGNGSYIRNDDYGFFNATYNWKAYYDPSTGYMVGYLYTEQDSDGSGDGFTYTDSLYITTHSYTLTPGQAPQNPPVISSFAATPSSFTLGSSTTLGVTASGGTGTLTYSYAGLPGGCTSADTPSLSCTPTATGTFAVRAYVNDSAGNSVSATTSFTVNPQSGGGGGVSTLEILAIVFIVLIIIVIIIAIALRSHRRSSPLPKHASVRNASYGPVGPAPPPVHLTPTDQPQIQQIVIKETVKVKCRYCEALIDSTAPTCPFCGAPQSGG
jgi:hypothetical protein